MSYVGISFKYDLGQTVYQRDARTGAVKKGIVMRCFYESESHVAADRKSMPQGISYAVRLGPKDSSTFPQSELFYSASAAFEGHEVVPEYVVTGVSFSIRD